ncbi:glycosyltransferase family 1 protein [Bacillus toyonensis]|nr:glycosyltransferase family 1 protein [Bacillus toyonensis]
MILKKKQAHNISHCGINSISESLYFEVLLVMLPLINDQHTIAERVHELGAGFMLHIQQLSAEDLKHAVNEVLQNPF